MNSVDGIIVKVTKLWWLKINTKGIRKTALSGAIFPHIIKIKYNVNNVFYEKSKIVCWKNKIINVGDKVNITYDINNPSKIIKLINL